MRNDSPQKNCKKIKILRILTQNPLTSANGLSGKYSNSVSDQAERISNPVKTSKHPKKKIKRKIIPRVFQIAKISVVISRSLPHKNNDTRYLSLRRTKAHAAERARQQIRMRIRIIMECPPKLNKNRYYMMIDNPVAKKAIPPSKIAHGTMINGKY